MRISPFDEYPFHQHPTPFGMVATSDSHFNDGYWFAFYAKDWYFFAGLRLHPNVNAIDGFASVAHDNRQRAVRASRALRPRYEDLSVGPISLEIIEPMKSVRLVLGPNPSGAEFDVVLETQAPPFVEDRYQHVKFGAIVNDTLRYTQLVRATGTARVDDTALEIDSWHGLRDHSWGVRSSMGVPTRINGIDRTAEEADDRAIRFWVPFQVGDHCGFFNSHEDADGNTLDFEGRLDFADGTSVGLVSMEHELTYLAGTKRPTGGTIELLGEDGIKRTYDLKASGSPADVQGIGYYRGWHDGLSAGVYRGAEVIEHDDYDTTPGEDPTGPPHVEVRRRLGPTEYPMFMTHEGREGMAHFEHHIFGPYKRYGFV